ncbi:hypothetical protein [Ruegeria arenilitoris]|uniref:hypothetical protein n=1 Tax=Ruegeria arenilitoris TaxID=1173585 RepID=UPI0014814D1B|nr:hypothetical protein [Ruegeria arenilitoris]
MNKAIAVTLCVFGIGVEGAATEQTQSRYYLGIGEPNPDAWQTMIDNPTDRGKDMGAALAAMGGEMISCFWDWQMARTTSPSVYRTIQAWCRPCIFRV